MRKGIAGTSKRGARRGEGGTVRKTGKLFIKLQKATRRLVDKN